MFKFLKNLFKSKEEPIVEEKIDFNNMEDWFNVKSKRRIDSLNNEINEIKTRIGEETQKTKNNLETLRNSKLQNPKITVKEKQFMEGNRNAYIKRVEVFLKQIRIEKEYAKLLEFCKSFDNMLESFGKSTIRTYHILQEFFANESRNISLNIKNFGNFFKDIRRKIEEKELEKLDELRNAITNSKNSFALKKKYEKELEELESSKQNLINSKEKIKSKVEELKNSNDYANLKELKQKEQQIIVELNAHNSRLLHSFSVIESAFKKYARIAFEHEKLIKSYLENPIKTLKEDTELKIIGILNNLLKNISTLQLKDKKKVKTMSEINTMNKEFFINFLTKHKEFRNKLSSLIREISENKVKEEIDKLDSNLKIIELDIEDTEKKISRAKRETEKIDIDKLKKELEKDISSLFKIKASIS